MKVLLSVIASGSAALLAVGASAATPSPSPTLDAVLAPPPSSNYVEADKTAPGLLEGAFDAHQYVTTAGAAHPSQEEATLIATVSWQVTAARGSSAPPSTHWSRRSWLSPEAMGGKSG